MIQKTFTLVILVFSIFLQPVIAQQFELVGPRKFNPDNWEIPGPEVFYADDNGILYAFIREASQPRTDELIRYDEASNTWENLTNNTFMIPGGASVSSGVGQPDGSIMTITRSFNTTSHYSYLLMPDGTSELIAELPASNFTVNATQAPNGDFYYVSSSFGPIIVRRYDGTSFTDLPSPVTDDVRGDSNIGVDEDGNVYVLYGRNSGIQFFMKKFDGTSWTDVDTGNILGYNPSIRIVSPTEMYISVNTFIPDDYVNTYFFDGTTLSSLGTANTLSSADPFNINDILKASNGDLFLAMNSANGIHKFDTAIQEWVPLENDIVDGGLVSGDKPNLLELNGYIYNSFSEFTTLNQIGDRNSITTVRFNLNSLSTPDFANLEASIKIFPVPATNTLNITSNIGSENFMATVYDITGRKLFSRNIGAITSTRLDVSSLASGNYVLKLESTTSKMQFFKKFSIE